MTMPKDELHTEYVTAWQTYLDSLDKALDQLDADITEAAGMADSCTSEWCQATENVIDDLSNALFSISEPRWSSPEDFQRIKKLKRRVHDLYADYRQASQKSGSAGSKNLPNISAPQLELSTPPSRILTFYRFIKK